MKKSKLAALVLAGAMVASLVGCGGGASEPASTPSTPAASGTEASADGAELNVMVETPVESLDPQIATDGTSFEVIANFTDGLTQMDEAGNPIPAIAESWDVSDDACTYTFHLREDANWANGDPVTAADFVFAWQRAVDPAVASEYNFIVADVAQVVNANEIIAGEMDVTELGVTAIDEKTLEVQLNVPVSYFTALMYFPTFYPVNQAFFESCGDTYATSPETVLSNGAFIMDDYEPAALSFHLTKNPDYYDAETISLGAISYQVIQDSQQALMSYQNGDLDTTLVSGEQVDQVIDDPEFLSVGAGYLWYLSPNVSGVPELANLNIRLAMTMALNREDITGEVTKDGSIPTYTAVPYDFAANFSEDQEKFSDVCRYDVDAAKGYWEAGLAELGVDAIELEMVVDADDEPQKVAQVIQEQLQTALPGLTITIKPEPKKQRVQDLQDGNYELGLTRWGPDYDDPMTYLGMWVTNNSDNYGLWSNEEYDAIIAECTTGDLCTEVEARRARLYDAEKIVMDNAVIFPLYTKSNAEMLSSSVTGIHHHPVALNRVYKATVKAE